MAEFLKLYEDLATANRHISESQVRVTCQAELARKLDEGGHDATEAQALLRVLQKSLGVVKAHREQIFREMARAVAANRSR